MEDTCTGCLSTGRKLFFIGETGYYHLYSQILNEIPVYDLSQVCVRICWECRARLRAMELFKHKVQQSYTNLIQRIPVQATSNLSSYPQYNFAFPEVPDVKSEYVVKIEPEEHCEQQFASALDVRPNGTTDTPQSQKKMSRCKHKSPCIIKVKKKRKKRELNNIKPEKKEHTDHFDNTNKEHNEKGYNEEVNNQEKQKKRLKSKLKSSSKNKVKKIRKIRESNNIKSDSEESAHHFDDMNEENNEGGYNDEGHNDEGHNEKGQNEEGTAKKEKTETVPEVSSDKTIEAVKVPKVLKRKRNTEVLPDRPQCQECGKVFSSKKTYRYHLNVLHKGQNQYPCPRCGKVYQWKSNLGRHMRSHRAVDDGELFCAQCDKSFASVATYRQHLRLSRRHVPQADFSFECGECGARFVNKTRLRDHVDWEHLNRIKFRCALCEKPFKCHTSLYVHTQNVHIARERKENLCHVCGKSYQNAAKLKYHITAMHSGETPYRCALCAAAFGWYSSLYRHMREVHYKMKNDPKRKEKSIKPPQSILRTALADTTITQQATPMFGKNV